MTAPFALTDDGFETQWQTNYLAHHLLLISLLPILESTAAGCESKHRVRIINVSGDAYKTGPQELELSDPNLRSMTGTMAPW